MFERTAYRARTQYTNQQLSLAQPKINIPERLINCNWDGVCTEKSGQQKPSFCAFHADTHIENEFERFCDTDKQYTLHTEHIRIT